MAKRKKKKSKRLTAKQRKKIPKKKFGLPNRKKEKAGSFPMPDKKHARLAISMAQKSYKAGNISKAQRDRVVAKARRILGTSKKKAAKKKRKQSMATVNIDADLNLNSNPINNLSDPTNAQDGATKNYVDSIDYVIPFAEPGTLTVKSGKGRFYLPYGIEIQGISAGVDTPSQGANIILDVNKNGSTIFTTQSNRPTILAGANSTSSEAVPDITSAAQDDFLTVDIDQVGTTTSGEHLTVIVRYRKV